jgi:hypothetical protein
VTSPMREVVSNTSPLLYLHQLGATEFVNASETAIAGIL